MAKPGRRPVLDEMKKREILAIVAVGCSRRTAAGYVGCSPSTITNEMQRDEHFAAQIERNESSAEISYVRNIQDAARMSQHWRAAAWLLERRWPDDFGPQKHGKISVAQLDGLLSALAQIIVEEVPVALFRKNILKRLQSMAGNFFRDLANKRKKDAVSVEKRYAGDKETIDGKTQSVNDDCSENADASFGD